MRFAGCALLLACLATTTSCRGPLGSDPDRSRVSSVGVSGTPLHAGSTYAWLEGSGTTGTGGEARSIESILIQAIDNQLDQRGLVPAIGAEPDYWIGFVAAPTKDLDAQQVAERFGTFLQGDDWHRDLTGSLLVLLVDPRTSAPVWKASAEATIRQDLGSRQRQQRLEGHVGRLFQTFPSVQRRR